MALTTFIMLMNLRGRGNVMMQDIVVVITPNDSSTESENRNSVLGACHGGPTFLQARDLHREARGRDVLHRRHPVLPGLLHLLVLHPKRLDGEATVTARNPSHICGRLRRRGDRGLVGGLGRCRRGEAVSDDIRHETHRQLSGIMTKPTTVKLTGSSSSSEGEEREVEKCWC